MLGRFLLILIVVPRVCRTCPQDFQPWYDDVCGYANVSLPSITFTENYQRCVALGSLPPSIHSLNENTQLRNAFSAHAASNMHFWIGLECRNDYRYSWDDATAFDYFNLYDDQDLAHCNENFHYAMFKNAENNKWGRFPQTGGSAIACVVPTTLDPMCDEHLSTDGSKCLKLLNTPMTWTNAEQTCTFVGGHLLSIHSEAENSFIRRSAIANGITSAMHIGLTNANRTAPKWTWTDDTPVNYANYAAGTQIQAPGCSSKVTFVKDDHVYSPSYPLRVELGECEYTVKTSNPNTKVALRVESFNIHMCCHQLLIYDGSEDTNLLAKLSGHVAPGTMIRAKGDTMRLVWNVKEAGKIEGWHFTVVEVEI